MREGLVDLAASPAHTHSHARLSAYASSPPPAAGPGIASGVGGTGNQLGAGALHRKDSQKSGVGKDDSGLESDWTSLDHSVTELEGGEVDDASSSTAALATMTHPIPNSHTQPHAHQPASVGAEKSTVAVTQGDMYTHVFVPIEEREVPALDIKYVVGIITEYIRSLNFHHVAVMPFLYKLLINFLVRNNQWYQLHQFLQYHVVSDSTHVASTLLSLEAKYPPAYQLALDMMKRLNTHEQIVEVLISKNLLLAALRFMKSHRVHIPPRRILEAAALSRDNVLFFHVFKFFESRKELSDDCEKYVLLARKMFEQQQLIQQLKL